MKFANETEEKLFVSYSDIKTPAFIIDHLNPNVAAPLCSVWEID